MNKNDTWLGLKNGDKTCLESLYNENVNILYNYGKKLQTDEELILDEIQNLFIYLWDHRTKLPNEVNSQAYLMTAFKNRIIDHHRRNKYHFSKIDDKSDLGASEPIENEIINIETTNSQNIKLNRALNKLTSKQKEIIYLKFTLNHSYEEISEILNINYQSVRNLVHRTITELRKDMIVIMFISYFTLK